MGKAVLITESDTPLGGALVRLFAAKGYSVVAAVSTPPGGNGAPVAKDAPGKTVSWNRRSPVSARNLLVSSLNFLDVLQEAFILEPPCDSARPLPAASSAEIERAYDDAKGPAFLAREVLSYFAQRAGGLLAMVGCSTSAAPLPSALREAFRGLAGSLFAAESGSGIIVNGFQSLGESAEEFAAFIDRVLEEKARKISGHWFVPQARGAFLQGVLSPPVRRA